MTTQQIKALAREITSIHIKPGSKNILFIPRYTGLTILDCQKMDIDFRKQGIDIYMVMVENTEGMMLINQEKEQLQ